MAVEEIKELDVDGVKVQVADLNANMQRFVQVYQEVHNKKVALENEILACNAAMRALSNDLVTAIRADREAEAVATEAQTAPVTDDSVTDGPVDTTAPAAE
jgi:predicted  nucleic acid-binding Zn-ribbon protein